MPASLAKKALFEGGTLSTVRPEHLKVLSINPRLKAHDQ